MLELLRVYSLRVRVHGDHGYVAYIGMLFNVLRSCGGQISSHVELNDDDDDITEKCIVQL